jgi:hypothetical protein
VFVTKTHSARLRAGLGRRVARITDRAPWEWYAESCSCGLPPGECRVHPRGRPSQRPPAGDRRVWAYVAGRGAGKTRVGACWMQHRVEQGTMKVGCLIAPTSSSPDGVPAPFITTSARAGSRTSRRARGSAAFGTGRRRPHGPTWTVTATSTSMSVTIWNGTRTTRPAA